MMKQTSSGTKSIILLLLGLGVVAWLYWPGLKGPFILDDFPALSPILDNSKQDFNYLLTNFLYSHTGPLKRPISMFSFIVDVYLHGADIWWLKLTNLFIHLSCAALIYVLCTLLIQRLTDFSGSLRRGTALGIALLWALHPLNVSAVLYTVQRMTELSALFSLLGMCFYVIGRNHLLRNNKIGWLFIGITLLACLPLAAFSKENGLLLLPILGLLEYYCFHQKAEESNLVTSNRFLILLVGVPLLIALIYILYNSTALFHGGYIGREFTLTQRMLTETRVLCLYLSEIFFPTPASLGFYHDDIVISTGVFQPLTTFLSIVALAGLLSLAVFLRKRLPMFSFGALFFFVGHAMESTVFPLELMFEHRNYLPMIGIMLAVANIVLVVVKDKKLLAVLGSSVAVLFGILLLGNTSAWSSEASLYPYLYRAHPNSERLNALFINNFAEQGDYKRAFQLLNKFNTYGATLNRLVIECMRDSKLSDSQLEKAMQQSKGVIDSYALTGLIRLANMGLDNKCHFSDDKFISLLNRSFAMQYHSPVEGQKIAMYEAHFLRKQGKLPDALAMLQIAHKKYHNNPVPLFLATHWLLESGDVAHANVYYQQALDIAKRSQQNYREMIDQIEGQFNQYRNKNNKH